MTYLQERMGMGKPAPLLRLRKEKQNEMATNLERTGIGMSMCIGMLSQAGPPRRAG